jgi:hypothetical protein
MLIIQALTTLKIELDNMHNFHSQHAAVTSHSAECDEHWFYRHQSHKIIDLQTF